MTSVSIPASANSGATVFSYLAGLFPAPDMGFSSTSSFLGRQAETDSHQYNRMGYALFITTPASCLIYI